MQRPGRNAAARALKVAKQELPRLWRDRLALLLALVTFIGLGSVFFLANVTHFLMPGPLASAHGAIDNCGACHTKSGTGKLSWFHGLVAGDPLADSKACLTCHKMPDTAFNAHSASAEVLTRSTERLTKVAAATPAPQSARAQNIAFPTDGVVERGVYCATCHQDHQGVNFDLNKVSNEQCRSCHVVKFDSFDSGHPKFDNYPFERRTRIIYDHAGHFGKHFPEIAQKDPEKRIPDTCSSCHNSWKDKRVMAVAPFDQNCATCHLDQITGKDRVSGPKGVAFLTLPGLDLDTLKKKNAEIGEWPDASEAGLSPFMRVMISRNERGRALLKTVNGLNLQDLSKANARQIKAVANLVWEIKKIFYELISGKASDVLANLNIGGGVKLSPSLVGDLTASIPRDIIIDAHQEWLPNLATEMADRPDMNDDQSGWGASVTETRLSASVSPEELSDPDAGQETPRLSPQTAGGEAASLAKTIRLAQVNQQVQTKNAPGSVAPSLRIDSSGNLSRTPESVAEPAKPQAAQPEAAAAKPEAANDAVSAIAPPSSSPGNQNDDLLFPTEEELRAIGKPLSASAKPDSAPAGAAAGSGPPDSAAATASPDAGAAAGANTAGAEPPARVAPVISIASDVDPESWAEYGGWYRQDYAIYYRPTGHKDKFIYSWLFLTGPQAPKGGKTPAAAVFDYLTAKDAQGSCVKCHSVDDIGGKARLINFSPPKPETKLGRFTNFIHEPHFGILENRGCMTCHNLEKGRPYLKTYEQGDAKNFVSNFGEVKKDLCQTCHTSNMSRQDCLTCHKYHVDGVITPMMSTKIPAQ